MDLLMQRLPDNSQSAEIAGCTYSFEGVSSRNYAAAALQAFTLPTTVKQMRGLMVYIIYHQYQQKFHL